jgi:hypothetical protein
MVRIFVIPAIINLSQLTANVVHSPGFKTRRSTYLHVHALPTRFIIGRISIIMFCGRTDDAIMSLAVFSMWFILNFWKYWFINKLSSVQYRFCGHWHVRQSEGFVMIRHDILCLLFGTCFHIRVIVFSSRVSALFQFSGREMQGSITENIVSKLAH